MKSSTSEKSSSNSTKKTSKPDHCKHPGWCDWYNEQGAEYGIKKGCRTKRCSWDEELSKHRIPDIEYDEVYGWRKKGMI